VQTEDFVFELMVHEAPPLVLVAVTIPREPPSFHRSCCHVPTRTFGFEGSTMTYGSTSVP
jgi:hypothetical protein